MKIAIIGSHGYNVIYGGYETFVKKITDYILNKDIKVIVYNRTLPENNDINNSKLEIIVLKTNSTKYFAQIYHSLKCSFDLIKRDVDIVLFLNLANTPFAFFVKFFTNTVINVDGMEWKRPKWKGLGQIYFYICAKLVKYSANRIITDSLEMQKLYLKKFNTPTKCISYGADIIFSSDKEKILNYSLKEDSFFLVVGRMVPDNNIDLIIKNYISIKTEKKLVIVGDVPYKDNYSSYLKTYESKNILFLGYINYIEILNSLYYNCYAYIHGHEYGGTNPSLLNALGCGACVIALDTIFNNEVLENGKYGILFNKNNDLSNKLEFIIENEHIRYNFKENARNRIIEKYTWEKIGSSYLELFNELKL